MRDFLPPPVVKVKGTVGWPRAFKSTRVAICFIDLSESGFLNVPLDKLSDFLRAKGYPQIAWAVDEQIRLRRVQLLIDTVDKDDALGKRRLIKEIIRNGQ